MRAVLRTARLHGASRWCLASRSGGADDIPGQVEGRGAGLARVLERNIASILARRRVDERRAALQDRLAERIGRFAGSMTFVYLHLVIVALWIAANVGLLPGAPRFDADFVKLATAASVEAIFLSTFVLVMQNRMAAVADRRADLDLQISLLGEHEVTRLIRLVAAIAERMGIEESRSAELEELGRDVRPEAVLDRIERAEGDEPREGAPPPT
ncbi:DUF1003 domain-containing protein [Anaeromyxobacter sp. SG66]|uniref:DUF1003 domain-containing protein n=1 Tax=Anaeromyxobacter sp. SG66 TaxID=2925410 RepID=UPI001F5A1814|nr:DUF1003 domain-containing protein [Anaeromyxobacter sp. SG66]